MCRRTEAHGVDGKKLKVKEEGSSRCRRIGAQGVVGMELKV